MSSHALTTPPTDKLRDVFADRFISEGAELDRVSRDESRYSPEGTALAAVFLKQQRKYPRHFSGLIAMA
ncbi:hypothetical protein ACTXIT_02490 [Corynebacterium casei]|uniref:hypothetical protein n=1 Tax=Corynebacterium casei TaxID=160386 RepID=UPI003FD0E84E